MIKVVVFLLLVSSSLFLVVKSKERQSITWLYANDLSKAASFFEMIGLEEILNLIQKEKCRIFRSDASGYLGVCNSRTAPNCTKDSVGNDVPVTITLIFEDRDGVDQYRKFLENKKNITLTEAGGSVSFGVYSFNFYHNDYLKGLGCYRFEAQSFDDPSFPSIPLTERLRKQLLLAGSELQESVPSKPILCSCEGFCSGQCFAASCDVCDADVWTDESSCLNPGPLGQGLLCAMNHTRKSNAFPCCSPNGTACQLEGGNWCDCSKFPKQDPLFPPLQSERRWSGEACESTSPVTTTTTTTTTTFTTTSL